MLEEILTNLELDADEIKTYLTLLESGPITAGVLAKKMAVPRPSLYGFLERLHQRGLVSEQLNFESVKVFAAEPPEKVSMLFDQQIEHLQKQQHLYKDFLPELLKTRATKYLSPKFQLFEGQDGVRHVLKDMLLYHDIETQAFWPIKAMIDILGPDFFRYLNKERIKSKLFTRAIWPESQVVDVASHPYLGVGSEFKREIRIAPKQIDFSMGYWMYANKAAFISSRKESFGFIIESTELTEMLLTQFEIIWAMSKPIKVNETMTKAFIDELKSQKT